jgi:predicted lipid-binding transport protein (Tim44 family)
MMALAATILVLSLAVTADAAPRFNAGSRGTRTFSAPPPTATAPKAAQPIERTMTQPSAATRPTTAAAPASPGLFGGMFGRGLVGGLLGGLVGAGLFGLLFGHGLFGGLGGFASILGLLLQIVIVVFVARLAWRWWQSRSQPAFASGPHFRDTATPQPGRPAFAGIGGSTPAADEGPIEVGPADFGAFERRLSEVYAAYTAEDLNAMRALMTPEMLSYYSEELAKNAGRGVVNQVTDVKLMQGDLSEAWREGNDEYASVAMRYSINDRTVERSTGRVIEGGPQEGVELWTFRRVRGGDWMLSAIQQTD